MKIAIALSMSSINSLMLKPSSFMCGAVVVVGEPDKSAFAYVSSVTPRWPLEAAVVHAVSFATWFIVGRPGSYRTEVPAPAASAIPRKLLTLWKGTTPALPPPTGTAG